MTEDITSSGLGAYGLGLPDLPGPQWLTPVPADWPQWRFGFANAAAPGGELGDESTRITDSQARIPLGALGLLTIDRASCSALVLAPSRPPPQAWAHPYLSPVAMVAADWSARLGFHGGSFLDARGRVWGVLGERERGKSTALAWLVARGRTVFADDLLITDGTRAFAGPRCIDLRIGAAEFFGLGTPLGVLGNRERWRVDLPQLSNPVAPLGGFVDLSWSDDGKVELERVDTAIRADRLQDARALRLGQQHPLAWLGVLGAPMFALRRPQHWTAQDDALELLLESVDTLS